MSEGLSRKVPVTFDDVAVYFSEEEWEILAEWQRELYKEVMKENLETVLSLGFQIPRPGVVSLMEQGGEACVQYPKDPAPETHFGGDGLLGPDQEADAIDRVAEQPREAPSLPSCDARVQGGWSSCSEFGPRGQPGLLGHWGAGSGAMHDGREDTSGLQPNQAEEQPRLRPRGQGSVAPQHRPGGEQEARSLQRPHCVKSFAPRPRLAEHLRTHSGDRPFKCLDCGKTFGKRSAFVVPCRSHTGQRPYPCPACQQRFSHRSRLLAHQGTRTGEEPHACAQGGKSFVKRRTHTGEKPYRRTTCERTFILRSNLVPHLRTRSGERPYRSAQGQKGFIRHQRTHTGHGERPYRCLKCGKGLHQPTNLATHQWTHLAERALPCSQPGRALLSPRESWEQCSL
ncbi:zinc finger protein 316 [Chelonia mydas]|uniref:zinc finger protein 316 n=1 Tax=Chelonia mydas TaxID=8469 RepID=UPI001CA84F56|nr:zinc finger protein 316 [Chelonia mydas]XP_043397760.1 zinc finger protein 316 [Chelonia mydas]